ncbi:beta barrel domain-containing protein [Roseivirga spongicola]|uniref:beta barrel domain-containing protein n=1 Tax=Roseivirga spongicola TaxID=333140 RepID=UPI002AC8C9D8|nr:hypothetical protein [Roseivirga spongicola]WPZ08783.1 hypothetical protein T7867_10990 [Roseivirga spongicola]
MNKDRINKKPEIGQAVFLRPNEFGNAFRRSKDIKTSVLSKVGRKYVTVEGFGLFEISTGRQKTELTPDYTLYFDEAELALQLEQEDLVDRIKNAIPTYGKWNLEVEKLRKIAEIMGC